MRNSYHLLLCASAALVPARAPAQVQPAPAADNRAAEVKELQDLQAMKRDMQSRMDQFDARIEALEQRLGVPATNPGTAANQVSVLPPQAGPTIVQRPVPPATEATLEATTPSGTRPSVEQQRDVEEASVTSQANNLPSGFLDRMEKLGTFKRDTGWVLVNSNDATEYLGLMTYARYLNQNALNPTYTDSFGRVIAIDRRNEVQLYKVSL